MHPLQVEPADDGLFEGDILMPADFSELLVARAVSEYPSTFPEFQAGHRVNRRRRNAAPQLVANSSTTVINSSSIDARSVDLRTDAWSKMPISFYVDDSISKM